MINIVAHAEAKDSHWLYKVSGAAALIVGGLLLAAALELVGTVFQMGTMSGWLTLLPTNWLAVIFKLHAGLSGVQTSQLFQLNTLDIVILVLITTMYIGLYKALQRTSRAWSLIALAQPILGIALFLATKSAGRSSVMGAELVISVVMLRSDLFHKSIAYIGLTSGVLLLAGDVGASLAPSHILAVLMGLGYILLVIWLVLVGSKLFQLGQNKEKE